MVKPVLSNNQNIKASCCYVSMVLKGAGLELYPGDLIVILNSELNMNMLKRTKTTVYYQIYPSMTYIQFLCL